MRDWKRYYSERPVVETYKGWKIRKYTRNLNYFGKVTDYVCDVRPGVESIMCSNINTVKEWIDKKIKEGKIQQEDTNRK